MPAASQWLGVLKTMTLDHLPDDVPVLVLAGAGEVAGSSPASFTISMKKEHWLVVRYYLSIAGPNCDANSAMHAATNGHENYDGAVAQGG
jgi:hypothetical protein